MECLMLAERFEPPPPYSTNGYFDHLTNNEYTETYFQRLRSIFRFKPDYVLYVITLRPRAVERAALLDVLETRLRLYGENRGFLEVPETTNATKTLTAFFVKDVLGLSGDNLEGKTLAEIERLLHAFIALHLTERGKERMELLNWIANVVTAPTTEERWRAILTGAGAALSKALMPHQATILRAMARKGPIPAAVVTRLRKIIALRMAWRVSLAARFRWVNPVLLALDLLLTPAEIGDDEKLQFLGIYTRVCEDRRILLSRILEGCHPDDWNYRLDPIQTLREVIRQG
jgi:hypothetical protein